MTNKDSIGTGEYMRNQHVLFANALLASKSIDDAAFQVGITTRTAYRYMQDEAFKAILHDLQQKALDQTAIALSAAASSAVQTLIELMQDNSVSPGVRSRCADLILQSSLRYVEVVSLASRVRALEEAKSDRGATRA